MLKKIINIIMYVISINMHKIINTIKMYAKMKKISCFNGINIYQCYDFDIFISNGLIFPFVLFSRFGIRPRIIIPKKLEGDFTEREITAMMWHEYGHIRADENIFMNVFKTNINMGIDNEHIADSYAVENGYGPELVNVLVKLICQADPEIVTEGDIVVINARIERIYEYERQRQI